jgi:membrane-associated protease RseP (regulator of RpoE activity)
VYLSLLAAGSALPDVLEIDLADQESTRRAARLLSERHRLFRPDLGLVAIDVADVKGAVVLRVDAGGPAAQAAINAGDAIIRVDGQDLTSASPVSQMGEVLAKAGAVTQVSVLVMSPASAVRVVQVPLQQVPRLVSMTDRTVLFNKMILDLRARLAAGITEGEEAVARLNLAVSLMAVQNWSDATRELDRVKLPQRPGLSAGTVSYLRGLCYQGLLDHARAQQEFEAALADKDALLTEDGGSVPELAKRALTGTGLKR